MSANPYKQAGSWLYTTLSTDTALLAAVAGVYAERVPPGTPWHGAGGSLMRYVVIIAPPAATDGYELGAVIVETTLSYLVKVVAKTENADDLATAVSRIHTLLHGQSTALSGGAVLCCIRTSAYHQVDEDDGGELYLHRGGRYELIVSE